MAAGLALWLWLRQHRPEVFGRSRWLGRKTALRPRPWAWALVAVFAVGGLVQAWQGMELADEGVAVSAVAPAASEALAKSEAHELTQALRIERLEAQLERARAPAFYALRDELNYWLDKIGLSYFWAAVYFTLLPLVWPGQTPGKFLLGLRVIELTGKTLTPLILFKRYGGYAAGMFTGGAGFVQLIWDSNRQAIQDKTAHTVVINARSSARLNELAAQVPT
jgi:NAD(P)-dependent dehydrogenase (short-subunit alcohol dehydrogenase family)